MTSLRKLRALATAVVLGVVLVGCSAQSAPVPSMSTSSRIQLPANPTVYFFGDSWTTGYNAEEGRGFPHVVGEAMDWNVVMGPDSSGAGYVHTFNPYHPVFPEVTKTIDRISADLIVVQGSVNDMDGPLSELRESIRDTITTLRARSDDTPIVMVGPAPYQTEVPQQIVDIDRIESAAAKQLRVPYVSPLRERWFTPQIVNALIDARQHPTTAGHAYFGGRLAADLAELTRQPAASSVADQQG